MTLRSSLTVVMIASAMPLAAQTLPAAPGSAPAQIQARHDIAALEGVLESAVGSTAQLLNQRVQASTIPQSVLLSGLARARGFRLDGYGVVFDVEFPSIRRSVAWTMRALERPDPDLLAAMKALRSQVADDQRSRQELDRAIQALEEQIKMYDARLKTAQTAQTVSTAGRPRTATPPEIAEDPRSVYARDLVSALITAILDHGAEAGVGPDEWLTVAARESLDLRFAPDDPNDIATTLILRIKGSDLNALRDHTLSREETLKRLEVKQY